MGMLSSLRFDVKVKKGVYGGMVKGKGTEIYVWI